MTEILDHGYLRVIETWGHGEFDHNDCEAGIIEAARQSTQGSFRGWDRDMRLLKYLYEHKHATPFEFAGMIIEVQAPIFVFREWHRHRTQSYNEMSARYAPLPDLAYVPSAERIMLNSGTGNNQAGAANGAAELTRENAEAFRGRLDTAYAEAEQDYQWALGMGIPKELARCLLPVGRYSRMRASANLRNWLAFLTLRMAPEAQWEIRQYANTLADEMRNYFPRTMELFDAVG